MVGQNSGLGSRNFVQWWIRTLVLDPGILFSGWSELWSWIQEFCSVVDQNSGLGSRNFVQWLVRTLVLDPVILFSD